MCKKKKESRNAGKRHELDGRSEKEKHTAAVYAPKNMGRAYPSIVSYSWLCIHTCVNRACGHRILFLFPSLFSFLILLHWSITGTKLQSVDRLTVWLNNALPTKSFEKKANTMLCSWRTWHLACRYDANAVQCITCSIFLEKERNYLLYICCLDLLLCLACLYLTYVRTYACLNW